jgi:hypothetical protein
MDCALRVASLYLESLNRATTIGLLQDNNGPTKILQLYNTIVTRHETTMHLSQKHGVIREN